MKKIILLSGLSSSIYCLFFTASIAQDLAQFSICGFCALGVLVFAYALTCDKRQDEKSSLSVMQYGDETFLFDNTTKEIVEHI